MHITVDGLIAGSLCYTSREGDKLCECTLCSVDVLGSTKTVEVCSNDSGTN